MWIERLWGLGSLQSWWKVGPRVSRTYSLLVNSKDKSRNLKHREEEKEVAQMVVNQYSKLKDSQLCMCVCVCVYACGVVGGGLGSARSVLRCVYLR